MPESHQEKEEHPLLCDECSDEDLRIQDVSGLKFHRRFRHSNSTGRARTHAIGAAAIISSWPDDISSLLAYWWIFLGMLAFMVFLIYNSFLAIVVLPKPYSPLKINNSSNYTTQNMFNDNPSTPNIYMHVFVANYEEFNSNDYIPYVRTIANKYTNFKYNLMIVLNDSNTDVVNGISDKQINELALNMLWNDNEIINKKELYHNLIIKHISLTEYMDNSPLKKYWRLLPYQFIGFLARCIAIWDKGGVAFNPLILTSKSPNSVYIEKLHSILGNFQSKNKTQKRKISKKSKKKFNNIRDIIIDIEKSENLNEYTLTDSLAVAENIPTVAVTSLKANRSANSVLFDEHNYPKPIEKQKDEILYKNNYSRHDKENKKKSGNFDSPIKAINSTKASGKAAAQKILPKFLEFLFHLNSNNLTSLSQNLKNFTKDLKLPESLRLNNTLKNDTIFKIDPAVTESSVKTKTKSNNKGSSEIERTKLIIDLKGNLIATETACHAFIGTVLSNVLHSADYGSLTDFIINELSLFCKGSLSTCNNVEVILL